MYEDNLRFGENELKIYCLTSRLAKNGNSLKTSTYLWTTRYLLPVPSVDTFRRVWVYQISSGISAPLVAGCENVDWRKEYF